MIDELISFRPIYQERVWGGRQLASVFGRDLPDSSLPFGESWEMVDRPEANSLVVAGPLAGQTLQSLWTQHRAEIFGEALVRHPAARFPLLMKILDARDDLSIQVHPPASVATSLQGEPKTEMWFIAHAEPGAKIYAGLKQGVTREGFEQSLQAGTVAEQVHVLSPQTGDCLFIPSGRIHAIGAGLLIYEIQQNSDTTYRVFDWNRLGLDGQPRQLHVAESLASIDFNDFEPTLQSANSGGPLVRCPFFQVDLCSRFKADAEPVIGQAGESLTLAVTRGHLTLGQQHLLAGDFALLPATLSHSKRTIKSASDDAQWLEVRVRNE
jgi:mannose-6-phosphate isomerase